MGRITRRICSIHGEDFFINDCRDGQAIEAIGECLPQLNIIPSLALVVKAVDPVNGSTLMIAPENEKVFWILDFVCQEQTDCLKGLFAPVHIIT